MLHPSATLTRHEQPRQQPPLFTPLGGLFLAQLADRGKAKAVAETYNSMDPDNGLSYEGLRQQLKQGRFPLDNLVRLCEAMAVNGVDPAIPISALEAACVPRDPDLNGTMLDELCAAAEHIGSVAADMRQHGHRPVDYTNDELREMMTNCGRLQAAVRRLSQECLAAYSV